MFNCHRSLFKAHHVECGIAICMHICRCTQYGGFDTTLIDFTGNRRDSLEVIDVIMSVLYVCSFRGGLDDTLVSDSFL